MYEWKWVDSGFAQEALEFVLNIELKNKRLRYI